MNIRNNLDLSFDPVINILSYNISGLKNKIMMPYFFEFILSHDIFLLYETFVMESDYNNFLKYFPGFLLKWVPAEKVSTAGRPSGGAIYGIKISSEIFKSISFNAFDSNYYLSIKFSNKIINILPVYINCNKWDADFVKFKKLIDFFKFNENIIVMGDLNGRIAEKNQFLSDEIVFSHKITNLRKSKDTTLNREGKMLNNFFDENSLIVLNGRSPGDRDGEKTFIGVMGSSCIDLCVASLDTLENVIKFEVLEKEYSDHLPIVLKLRIEIANTCKNQNLVPKLHWKEKDALAYFLNLSALCSSFVIPQNDPNKTVEELLQLMERSVSSRNNVKKFFNSKSKWFDARCYNLRLKSFSLLKEFRRTNSDLSRKEYLIVNAKYKYTCKTKQQKYFESIASRLDEVDVYSKKWWNILKDLKNEKYKKSSYLHIDDFYSYFKVLLNSSPSVFNICYVESYIENDMLDKLITLEEVEKVLKTLPSNKAPGTDRIPYEFFKFTPISFKKVLMNLFNSIFTADEIPMSFKDSLIFPIYKKGNIESAENYRGISFLNSIAKIFSAILLHRLQIWEEHHKILNEYQAGFRRNYSTFDNIYNLTSIIQIYGNKLYCFFVDFKAAFDTVNRNALFYKLHKLGISTKFLRILREWYTNNRAAIWDGENLSNFMETTIGLRQGCLLSPILFALFINDLYDEIKGGCTICGINIRVLMYADDIVLITNKPEILQSMMNKLHTYCEKWNLVVNLQKSKVIIFNKSGRTAKHEKWYYGSSQIDVVPEYKYLGMILTSKLSMARHFEEKLKLAKFTLSTIWHSVFRNININLSLKYHIFYTMSRSVMCYGAQIWGHVNWDDVEKLQRYFIKWLLHLPSATPSYMLQIETRTPSLHMYCLKLHFKYMLHIFSMEEGRMPILLSRYFVRKKLSWVMSWQRLGEICNKPVPVLQPPNLDSIKQWCEDVTVEMKIVEFNAAVRASREGCHHNLYPYLDHINYNQYFTDDNSIDFINIIFRSRCDLLPLNAAIFMGKSIKVCSLCNLNQIENVYHFIARCPIFAGIRFNVFHKTLLSQDELIKLLNGENYHTLYKYVKTSLKYRSLLINEFNYS